MEYLDEQLRPFGQDTCAGETLAKLGIISSVSTLQHLALVADWQRGGSETYILVFDLVDAYGTRRLVVKAYAPSFATMSVELTFAEWIKRRKLLAAHGIQVPRLYAVGAGVLLEDFIPHSLGEQLASGGALSAISDLMKIAKTLGNLGFRAISPFEDLRTDGVRAFMVDFGSDLGGPSYIGEQIDYCEKALQWLQSLKCQTVNIEAIGRLANCRDIGST